MMVPSAIPTDIVTRLNRELLKTLHRRGEEPGGARGSEVIDSTHEQAIATFQRDIAQWAELVRRTGIRLE